MAYFDHILHTYTFQHCLDTCMQNYDKALLSISLTGHAQFVKMLINLTLEPHEFCLLKHFKMVFGNVVCGCSLAVTSTGPGGLMALGAPAGSTCRDSGFKVSQKMGHSLKSHPTDWESKE